MACILQEARRPITKKSYITKYSKKDLKPTASFILLVLQYLSVLFEQDLAYSSLKVHLSAVCMFAFCTFQSLPACI